MNQPSIDNFFEHLKGRGVQIDDGLSDSEVEETERLYGLIFPPDLRRLLQTALPVSERFPNWRAGGSAIADRLNWPLDGICFDIEHNGFWLPEWGTAAH